jgi:hypothetical protein
MAKPSQTFKKRQRENKLREKSQMKRERRQQRGMEKKFAKETGQVDSSSLAPQESEQAWHYDRGGQSNS